MGGGRAVVRVLIIEDEWLIAEDLKLTLQALGCEVLGPAASCERALDILNRERPDVAFVDLYLGPDTCEAVIKECERQGISIVVCTGETKKYLPEFCADKPLLSKPYTPDDVARTYAQQMNS
ncbi:MAG: response regulator protein [Devosia sp.]|nr:response regulator protein [Devosia sp.]